MSKSRRFARLVMLARCGAEGRQARRLGLTRDACPYRGKTGTGRAQADAWRDGWDEEDRDQKWKC